MHEVPQADSIGPSSELSVPERERLAVLISETSTALVRGHELRATLHECCKILVRNLDAAFARIWTLNEAEAMLELQASAGLYTHLDGPHSRVPVGKFKIGLIAEERKPHLTNDVQSDPRVSDRDWAKREGMVAFAGYPLIVENQLVGVVALFARQPLSDDTLRAIASVADGLSLGIERMQADAQLKEQSEQLETIHRLGSLLSAELDLQKLVQAVTDAATELSGAQFGSFFYNVINDNGGAYTLYTLSGVPREAFANFPMPRATQLFGPTFRGEGTIRLGNVREDPRYGKMPPHHGMPKGHLPVTSYLAVPVIARSGEVLGGLFFGHSDADVFTERHERIIQGLAAQAAIAMDNARLYESAQSAIREREALLASEQAARRETEVANRAKDEFLGVLSHELRTPLNVILGWTSMIRSGKLDLDHLQSAVEAIDRNAKLQARLIDDMLDVSRIISGKLRLETQPVDLSPVIEAAFETLASAAEAKDIQVVVGIEPGHAVVLGDPVRLQQVFWNLISNAIRHTPSHGRVDIDLRRVDSRLEVSVADSGPGVEPSFLPFVFDRFRQADSSTSRRHGGLGLGLSIVRHLAELHGGTVKAQNRDEGGARFTVSLPVMAVRAPFAAPAEVAEPTAAPANEASPDFDCPESLRGLRILVVDDEPDARDLLHAVLSRCGSQVNTCASTAEALQAMEQEAPDVLVSDIGMPEADGYELIRQVREREPAAGGRVPAVALTAYARFEDRMKALSAGYNMHVSKPVEPMELVMVIAGLSAQGRRGPSGSVSPARGSESAG